MSYIKFDVKTESVGTATIKTEFLFEPKMFLCSSKWKMFFIRFFGKKIVSIDASNFGDYSIKTTSYKFKDKIYYTKTEKL